MTELTKFDSYLGDDGPAALVLREPLMPVEGADGVVFPATFAAGDNFPGGYNIDGDPNGKNVCLVDSVGSQANRIEPIFAKEKYVSLVPQIVVKAGSKSVSLLEAGHRAGDALVRCSELQLELQKAFQAVLSGNAEPLAKIAPTSLVFGVWDSRDTQAKLPRIISSTIRAYDIRELHRSAQYIPPIDYVAEGQIDPDLDSGTGKTNPLAVKGFKHNPATWTHGGVIATGGIRRDAVLGLAALRLLNADSETQTFALRRYILGLSLVAFTCNSLCYLRQGCLLVCDPHRANEREFVEVLPSGERKPVKIEHETALEYARKAAAAFGVGKDQTVSFDKERARKDIQEKESGAKKKGKKTEAAAGATGV